MINEFTDYVHNMNRWYSFGVTPKLAFPLTQKMINALINQMNLDFSDEDINEDGEATAEEAQSRYTYLELCVEGMRDYCTKNNLKTHTLD